MTTNKTALIESAKEGASKLSPTQLAGVASPVVTIVVLIILQFTGPIQASISGIQEDVKALDGKFSDMRVSFEGFKGEAVTTGHRLNTTEQRLRDIDDRLRAVERAVK